MGIFACILGSNHCGLLLLRLYGGGRLGLLCHARQRNSHTLDVHRWSPWWLSPRQCQFQSRLHMGLLLVLVCADLVYGSIFLWSWILKLRNLYDLHVCFRFEPPSPLPDSYDNALETCRENVQWRLRLKPKSMELIRCQWAISARCWLLPFLRNYKLIRHNGCCCFRRCNSSWHGRVLKTLSWQSVSLYQSN